MSSTTRTRITATPLYPGSFFPEDGRPVVIADDEPQTALAALADDDAWFALEVRSGTQKRYSDGDGDEFWRWIDNAVYRLYVGEVFTAADVASLDDGQDHSILMSNMRCNGWGRVVRTRRGNFQPLEPGDVVIAPAEATR